MDRHPAKANASRSQWRPSDDSGTRVPRESPYLTQTAHGSVAGDKASKQYKARMTSSRVPASLLLCHNVHSLSTWMEYSMTICFLANSATSANMSWMSESSALSSGSRSLLYFPSALVSK